MLLPLSVLLCFAALVAVTLPRINELFYLSLRDGESLVVRGAISPALRQGIVEILERAELGRARVRALKSGDGVQLVVQGVDDRVAQRLRNYVGTHPSHALRAGYRFGARNLGQRLGFEWLAWACHGKRLRNGHDRSST